MRRIQSIRYFLLALLLAIVPVTSAHAGVFISVGIAPPPLPVYVQPPCPEPNMIWSPGYWAYDYDMGQYYWVPGAWVPAPYEGALWTPPYWGWNDGVYLFHAGYWGPTVGYYGGVNYGFGYMGIGFVGGEWREHHFFYNTAVINVNRTYIHNTYINNTIIHEHTVVNNNRIAFEGGPRGIQHMPTPEERRAMQMPHVAPTHFQEQHIQQARSDRQNFFNANHGRPQTVALSRPLPAEHVQAPNLNDARRGIPQNGGLNRNMPNNAPTAGNRPMQPLQNRPQNAMQPNQRQNEAPRVGAAPVNQQPQHGFGGFGNAQQQPGQRPLANTPQPMQRTPQNDQQRTMQQQHSLSDYQPNGNRPQQQPQLNRPNMPQAQPVQQPQRPEMARPQMPQYRPAPQPQAPQQYRPQPMQQPQPRPEPQSRVQPIPSYRPTPQSAPQQYRPQPQPQYRPQPEPQYRPQPQPQFHPQAQPQYRPQPQPQFHPQPQQRAPESRPAPMPRNEGRPHR